jgi:hypothetical protein
VFVVGMKYLKNKILGHQETDSKGVKMILYEQIAFI